MQDCSEDKECKLNYPDHPICDLSTGKCSQLPDNLKPPDIFNENDICKKLYGDIFVHDKEAKACRIPKCDVSIDYCPKPSQCWRGTLNPVGHF